MKQLVKHWRTLAAASREEALQMLRTVKKHTDAEERCFARAEVWDKCADELEQAIKNNPNGSPPLAPPRYDPNA